MPAHKPAASRVYAAFIGVGGITTFAVRSGNGINFSGAQETSAPISTMAHFHFMLKL
jgi:hypothetical protein